MPVPMAKGSNLIELVKLARKNRDTFKKLLPAETREFMETRILPASWYPEVHLEKLLIAADKALGKGNLEFCRSLGKIGARWSIEHLYGNLVAPGDVGASLAAFPTFWSLLHDTGTATVEVIAPDQVRVALAGFGHPSLPTCLTTTGWIEGTAELAGATCRVVEEKCRTRGEEVCVWVVQWSRAPETEPSRGKVADQGAPAATESDAPKAHPTIDAVALAKGSILIDLVKMARKDRQAFVKVLPSETQAFIQTRILVGSWYPEVHFENLLVAADRVHGKGDLMFCWTLGATSAQQQLRGAYQTALCPGKPERTLALLTVVWSLHHNTGTPTMEVPSPGYVRFQVSGFGHPSRAQCLSMCGFIEGAVRASGGQAEVVEACCRNRGDAACVYDARWTVAG